MKNETQVIDNYDYSTEAGPIRRFLWFCAGADPQLMQRCTHSERVKEEGVGGVVFATAILAFASGSYALNFVFDSLWVAGFMGAVWALVIFNLDRFIITATGHGDGTNDIGLKEFGQASPRLLMAIIIGVCLSAPLEIRIFQTEINAILQVTNDKNMKDRTQQLEDKFTKLETSLTNEIDRTNQSIDKKETIHIANIKSKNEAADKQSDEVRRESKDGVGVNTKWKKKELEEQKSHIKSLEARFQAEKMDSIEKVAAFRKKIQDARDEKDNKVKEIKEATLNVDGLAKRLEIMHEEFFWQSVFLMLLLMMIEVTPVIAKMMLKNESYYYLMENQHEIVIAKYAIEKSSVINVVESGNEPGVNSNASEGVPVTYHQAEAILETEKGKLDVESQLTKIAHAGFVEMKSEEFKNDPSVLISESSSKRIV